MSFFVSVFDGCVSYINLSQMKNIRSCSFLICQFQEVQHLIGYYHPGKLAPTLIRTKPYSYFSLGIFPLATYNIAKLRHFIILLTHLAYRNILGIYIGVQPYTPSVLSRLQPDILQVWPLHFANKMYAFYSNFSFCTELWFHIPPKIDLFAYIFTDQNSIKQPSCGVPCNLP